MNIAIFAGEVSGDLIGGALAREILRTVPDVASDGAFLSFLPHQIYHSAQGFGVNTHDAYEVVMVHHRPLHDPQPNHGMGNYLLYMTPGECRAQATTGP